MSDVKKITQIAWDKFLRSDAGIEGMLVLRERTPSVHKGESHDIIFEAGVVEGYRRAIDAITHIISVEQPKNEELENI